jgi:flagellar assembly factor FliW
MNASCMAATVEDRTLTIDSDLLGTLQVEAEHLLQFPRGILGFPECSGFALVPAARDGFFWLQSVDHTTLTFLTVDPFLHFPGYAVDLGAAEIAVVEPGSPADLAVLAIVTLPGGGGGTTITANLQGPLVLDLRRRLGRQIVLADSEFGVRTPFDPEAAASPTQR